MCPRPGRSGRGTRGLTIPDPRETMVDMTGSGGAGAPAATSGGRVLHLMVIVLAGACGGVLGAVQGFRFGFDWTYDQSYPPGMGPGAPGPEVLVMLLVGIVAAAVGPVVGVVVLGAAAGFVLAAAGRLVRLVGGAARRTR